MADFCKECSELMFGEDFGELALAKTDERRGTLKEGEGWTNFCEGCGAILCDDDGKCLDHTYAQHVKMITGHDITNEPQGH